METIYGVQALLLFLLFCSTGINCDGSSDQTNDDPSSDLDGSSFNKRQYLWFGPRLGRNKRNPAFDEDVSLKDISTDDNIVDLIRDSSWALIPLRGSERNMVNFTPRLGRNQDDEGTMEASRSPPFAPRLGRRRHILPFSPRLGRTFSSQASH